MIHSSEGDNDLAQAVKGCVFQYPSVLKIVIIFVMILLLIVVVCSLILDALLMIIPLFRKSTQPPQLGTTVITRNFYYVQIQWVDATITTQILFGIELQYLIVLGWEEHGGS